MSINKVVVSGNLTRDPELRSSQGGTNILTFGMAVNDRRRNPQTQEWEEYANFVDCVLFGNRADYMHRTLHKGMKVVVEGRLRYSSWEREGQRRSKLEVVVDDIDFISPRQQQGGYAPQQGGGYQNAQQSGGYAASQPSGGYGNQPMGGYGNQSQGYAQGPSYSAPTPSMTPSTQPTNQGYGAPRSQAPTQSTSAAPAQGQQTPPSPTPAPPAPVVTAPPETDVYDSDIPF